MTGEAPERFAALDSWRGIAALMVVVFHSPPEGVLAGNILARHSWLFVEFFFVLSGFVIASAYYRKLAEGYPLANFMALRLGRLFPLHAFVLVLFIPLYVILWWAGADTGGSVSKNSLDFLRTLFFVQIFAEPPVTGWNDPNWSIAAEFWVYGLAATGIVLCRGWVFLMAAIAALLSLWPLYIYGPAPFEYQPGIALVRALFGFALGMIVWRVGGCRTGPSRGPRSAHATVGELIAVIAVGGLIAQWGDSLLSLALPVFFALTIGVFSFERGAISVLLRHQAFAVLGELSYAIYIGHMLVIACYTMAKSSVPIWLGGDVPALPGDLVTLLLIALSIMFAWAMHRWIERPARAWTYRRVADREARRAEAIAPTF